MAKHLLILLLLWLGAAGLLALLIGRVLKWLESENNID